MIAVGGLDEPVALGHQLDAVQAVLHDDDLADQRAAAVSSSRNESKSAPMAASVPPVPPVRVMSLLVIDGPRVEERDGAEEIARALRDRAAGVADIDVVQDRHRVGRAGDRGAAVGPDQDAVDRELHAAGRRWFRRSCGR